MKKNLVTKVMSLLLVGVMMLGLIACGNEQPKESSQAPAASSSQAPAASTPAASTPAASEPADTAVTYPMDTDVEISVYLGGAATLNPEYPSYADSWWHSKVSEVTGIKTNFVAKVADATALELMLTDKKQAPDIFFSGYEGVTKYQQKVEDGYALELTDYLEEYAPNYWAFINKPENAEFLKQIKADDGSLNFIAAKRESNFNITYMGPMVRKDWLDECGLKEPVTLEDFEKVLTTFKDKYGAKLAATYSDFKSAGIASGTGSGAEMGGGFYIKDGKLVAAALQPEWRKMVEVFADWNKKGLIDGDFFTMDRNILRQKVAEGKTGMVFTAMSQLTNYITDAEAEGGSGAEWVGIEYARTAAGAPTTRIQAGNAWEDQVTAHISAFIDEEKLPIALAWIDYFYTEEGILFANFGVEGESYTMVNGEPKWTAMVYEDPSGMAQVVTKYGAWNGTFIGVQMEAFLKEKNMFTPAVPAAVYKWTNNTADGDYRCPTLTLTADEQKEYSDTYTPISTYINQEVAKFLNLEQEIDWNKFETEIKKMGIERVVEIRQGAYDRYLAK